MSVEKMQVTAEQQVGMPAHFHYDPYYNRYMEHLKQLLVQGNPIIVRLHPGFFYPMDDDTLHYRVDREGHVVSIVGYDDNEGVFILADPWNSKANGGERSGFVKMPYMMFAAHTVDGTLDAMTTPMPWEIEIDYPEKTDDDFDLKAKISYTCPVPLARSYNHLHGCVAKITLPEGMTLVEDEQVKLFGELGTFSPGESVDVQWKVRVEREIKNQQISIQARGIVSSDDPYSYSDVIGNKGIAEISLTPTRVLI